MKASHHQFAFILALSALSAVAACQSCLIDLASGNLRVGSTKGTDKKKPQQHHAVSHSSVLPIGISTGKLVRPIIPRFISAASEKGKIPPYPDIARKSI